MHTMQSVDDSTTLFSRASRRLTPSAYASARQVCSSSERIVAATNVAASTSANGATSSTTRARGIEQQRCGRERDEAGGDERER